jgi:hypothetical protein
MKRRNSGATQENAQEKNLSLSLYRRRRSSRPRLHSVNADTVNKPQRLSFSFLSILFFFFWRSRSPWDSYSSKIFQFGGGRGGRCRGFCTFFNPPSPT